MRKGPNGHEKMDSEGASALDSPYFSDIAMLGSGKC